MVRSPVPGCGDGIECLGWFGMRRLSCCDLWESSLKRQEARCHCWRRSIKNNRLEIRNLECMRSLWPRCAFVRYLFHPPFALEADLKFSDVMMRTCSSWLLAEVPLSLLCTDGEEDPTTAWQSWHSTVGPTDPK